MILMNDFIAEPEDLRREQLAAAERVLGSGWFILGREVKTFEAAWANYCGVHHAVGVGNGMDAIEIGLRAAGIGRGDEVVTTPMTAFATVLAVIRSGATPVLADIDPQTALLDIKSVERCISPRTKAVLLVHLYGQISNMEIWTGFCRKHRLLLFEDCAQSHGAKWDGKSAGSFGVCGAYSFYPTKNLGAIGDGGAIVTDDEEIAKRSAVLRNYGQSERYHHPELGLNSRLDELQAALLSVRLKWLEEFNARRRAIAELYFGGIRHSAIRLMDPPPQAANHVNHLFVVLCGQRDKLSDYLREKNIASLIHYPVPVHMQKPCRDLVRDPRGLSNSEKHAAQCLSIPCHPQMPDADVQRVIEALNAFR